MIVAVVVRSKGGHWVAIVSSWREGKRWEEKKDQSTHIESGMSQIHPGPAKKEPNPTHLPTVYLGLQ